MALKADAFPATMLTSQHGIREFHSGPKYGRIEIGDHKLTKIDRGRDLATQGNIREFDRVTKAGKVSRPNPQQWSSGGVGGSAAFRTIPSKTPARNRAQSFGLPGWMPATG
ncbi:MAG TPA: hypothetical protein VK554_03350 [Bradyrhizobium sp.]|nr:hypothetical protein [Bradyrhizobium sp.]